MVEVKTVSGRRDIKKFVLFPLSLYKNHPCYVPDMVSSQINDLLEDKNPAFEYCKARSFLAYKDGKLSGRVTGILNTRANEKDGHNYLRFANFDFVDDAEVTNALYHALEDYARELGCEGIHGPQGFSDMDREGMLVEGFEYLSQFFTYYNYPYYPEHMDRLGFEKEIDWVEYRITVPTEVPRRMEMIVEAAKKKHNLHVADLSDKKNLPKYIRDVFVLYNEAYQVLFGMVPLTPRQIDKYVSEFKPLISNRTSAFVYNDKDELLAFGVGSQSISKANQKSRGRMLPFGWARLLKALYGKNDSIDMFLIAVKPELKGAGLNLVVLENLLRKGIQNGVKYAETGPQLEDNANVQSMWRVFNARQHKRRRCYLKRFEGAKPVEKPHMEG